MMSLILFQLTSYSRDLLFSSETSSDFDNSEPILAQRCIALHRISERQRLDHVTESPVKRRQTDLLEVRQMTTKAFVRSSIELGQLARNDGRFQVGVISSV